MEKEIIILSTIILSFVFNTITTYFQRREINRLKDELNNILKDEKRNVLLKSSLMMLVNYYVRIENYEEANRTKKILDKISNI